MRFDLSDEEWAVIEPLLPPTRQGGVRHDDRQVLNGIFYARCARESRGTISRPAMARTPPPTIASIAGPSRASGSACSKSWQAAIRPASR